MYSGNSPYPFFASPSVAFLTNKEHRRQAAAGGPFSIFDSAA
jgi:hypothetical protein